MSLHIPEASRTWTGRSGESLSITPIDSKVRSHWAASSICSSSNHRAIRACGRDRFSVPLCRGYRVARFHDGPPDHEIISSRPDGVGHRHSFIVIVLRVVHQTDARRNCNQFVVAYVTRFSEGEEPSWRAGESICLCVAELGRKIACHVFARSAVKLIAIDLTVGREYRDAAGEGFTAAFHNGRDAFARHISVEGESPRAGRCDTSRGFRHGIRIALEFLVCEYPFEPYTQGKLAHFSGGGDNLTTDEFLGAFRGHVEFDATDMRRKIGKQFHLAWAKERPVVGDKNAVSAHIPSSFFLMERTTRWKHWQKCSRISKLPVGNWCTCRSGGGRAGPSVPIPT